MLDDSAGGATHFAVRDRPIHILGAGLSGLTSAILLARGGREVHVYDIRADSGARFAGDFQAIENWTQDEDFFEQMRDWGLDPDGFRSTAMSEIDVVFPDDRTERAHCEGIAFRLVERGTAEHTIDQGFKRQALDAGVALHYNTRRAPEDCDIVATGPRQATGVVRGELFRTSQPNQVTLQLNDKLAPGGYTYLIVLDGIGLICTVIMRRQNDADRFLNETLAWYSHHRPDVDREPIRRVGGTGCFAVTRNLTDCSRLYVGEAGGIQDCLWGFGMRWAITSGYLASEALQGRVDYTHAVRTRVRPYQQASLTNRWLLDRMGPRGMSLLARFWMRDQRRRGEGLSFISRLYRPATWKRALFHWVAPRILRPAAGPPALKLRYVPISPARKRDQWSPSPAGRAIAAQRSARFRSLGESP